MDSKKIKINLIDIGSVGGIEEPWDIRYINNLIQFEPNQSSVVKKIIGNFLTLFQMKIKLRGFMFTVKMVLDHH